MPKGSATGLKSSGSRSEKGNHSALNRVPVTKLQRLWAGELALEEAFWTWAVIGGFGVNFVTSVLFLILVSLDRPILALIGGYAFSLPYNAIAMIGVWRSAARDRDNPARAHLFCLITIIGMVILSVT